MHTYPMTVAGVKRELPICKVTDDLYIGAFICFGDAELTVACARESLPGHWIFSWIISSPTEWCSTKLPRPETVSGP